MYEFVPLVAMAAFFAALFVPDRCLRADARAIFGVIMSCVATTGALRRLLGERGSRAGVRART